MSESWAAWVYARVFGGNPATFARRIWLAWAVVRLFGFLGLRGIFPYNHTYPSDGDIALYWEWSSALWHGAIPYRTNIFPYALVYPPGILPALGLPPFSFAAYRVEFLIAGLVVDALILRALLRSGRKLGTFLWVISSLLLGPVFWCRFDIFVAGMLVAAVLAFERRRYGWASFWIVWAGLVKIWPLLLLILLFRLVPPERRRLFAGVGGGALAVGLVPFLAAGGAPGLWYVVQQQAGRGVELESLFAVPLYAISAAGHGLSIVLTSTSFQFIGSADSVMAGVSTGLMAVAVIYLGWRGLVRPAEGWDAARWLLLVAVLLITTDKVLSPQYLIWTTAAVTLFVDRCRWRLPVLVSTATLLVATQLQFPLGFPQLIYTTNLALPLSAVHGAVLVVFALITVRSIHARTLARDDAFIGRPTDMAELVARSKRVSLGVIPMIDLPLKNR